MTVPILQCSNCAMEYPEILMPPGAPCWFCGEILIEKENKTAAIEFVRTTFDHADVSPEALAEEWDKIHKIVMEHSKKVAN